MKMRIANPAADELAKFFAGVIGVVEANSFESMCLWERWHKELGKTWKGGGGGPMIQVGSIAGDDDMPVCIAPVINEVDGHKIAFVDVTSRYVDHEMVRDWLDANLPVTAFEDNDPRKRLNITNAMNFCNVFPRRSVAA